MVTWVRPVGFVALLATVGLAGCSADSGPQEVDIANLDERDLAVGKGAITGLLIDDAFRPIHLVESGSGGFRAEGFILLQELGRRAMTNANGEFAFLDVAPGTYTLRATVSGHEATPATVRVIAGQFAEADILARRVVSSEGDILTQEFSIFVPCAVGWVIQMIIYSCGTDLSGDNSRFSFGVNYTAFEDTSFLITEMKANQPHYYNVQVREDDGTSSGGARFAVAELWNEDYVKIVNQYGVKNTEHDGQNRNEPWNNTVEMNNLVFPGAPFHTEINQALGPYCNEGADDVLETIDDAVPEESVGYAPIPRTCGRYWGLGPGFAYEARFIQSLFLGEPTVSIDTYCVICQ